MIAGNISSDASREKSCDQHEAVLPLNRHDAVKVRAAHRIPSFSVAVEVVYQFLRSLLPPSAIRVVAMPFVSNLTVDFTAKYYHNNNNNNNNNQMQSGLDESNKSSLLCGGGGEAELMSELAAVSRKVKLRVTVELAAGSRQRTPPFVLDSSRGMEVVYEKCWKGTDTGKRGEPSTSCTSAAPMEKIKSYLQQLKHHGQYPQQEQGKEQENYKPFIIHLRCEVHDLFYCLPVRQRSVAGGIYSSYRVRAERESIFSALYRMAVECILAPLYFPIKKGTGDDDDDDDTSLYLHFYNNNKRTISPVDTAEVVYVHNSSVTRDDELMMERSTKRHRVEHCKNETNNNNNNDDSQTLRTAHRVVSSFFPRLRPWNEPLGWSNKTSSSYLREVIVEPGTFAVLFLLPGPDPHESTRRLGRHHSVVSTVVVSRHTASMTCYVVDESHSVYRHVSHLLATLHPLVIFMSDTLLSGKDATLQKLFKTAERKYHSALASTTTQGTISTVCMKEKSLSVVGKFVTGNDTVRNVNVAKTMLRVSYLAECLSSVNNRTSMLSGPRRTPFCPVNLPGKSCGTSTLSQVRCTMGLTLNPSFIAPRAYTTPSAWPGFGETNPIERTPSPFRAKHFIAQWDCKFLLLHTSNMGGEPGDSPRCGGKVCSSCIFHGVLPTTTHGPPQSQHNLPALYIVDQHAIHERLRLEFFLATAESFVQQNTVPVTFPVKIPDDICRDVSIYEDILKKWGWHFAHGGTQRGETECTMATIRSCVAVTQWPRLEIEGHVLLLDTIETLRRTVEELVTVLPSGQMSVVNGKEDKDKRNLVREDAGGRVVPSAVLDFLITRSCRGAVMFGDSLTTDVIEQLIDALQAVQQYTLCSHGRPSFAVIHSRKK